MKKRILQNDPQHTSMTYLQIAGISIEISEDLNENTDVMLSAAWFWNDYEKW